MEAEGAAQEHVELRATRFNRRALEAAVVRQVTRLHLSHLVRDQPATWLRRDFTVTVWGEPEAVAEFVQWVGSLREGAGDNPGPAGSA